MNDERKRRTSTYLTATAVVLGLYVAGYFWLGEHDRYVDLTGVSSSLLHRRTFRHTGFFTAYYPMGWLECRVRGEEVVFMVDGSLVPTEEPFSPP